MRLRASFLGACRPFALSTIVLAAAGSGACGNDFDTSRRAPPPVTVGDDLFQVLCDRVAATADPADVEARKSRAVCHPDQTGKYGDDYLPADQPMPAKVAVMVRYRPKLIDAFNATFPDKDNLHQDLQDLLADLVPLYDDDTLPESTRTLAAIFQTIFFDDQAKPDESPPEANARKAKLQRAEDVRAALARLGGRKGYRTVPTAIGIARPALAYPKLSEVVDNTIRLVGAGGPAEAELHAVLQVTQLELANTTIPDARKPIMGYGDRFSGIKSQKPKLTSEILRNLLVDAPPLKADLSGPAYALNWADQFAPDGAGGTAPPTPFLIRDARGYAAFQTTPTNVADKDGDGLPDVDKFGRFVGMDGRPLALPSPFAYVTEGDVNTKGTRDDLGRALTAPGGAPIYKYSDASRTLLHAILRDTKVLADPKNQALLDLAHGAVHQFGPRVASSGAEGVYADPEQPGQKVTVSFKKFDADKSPITDLVYALGAFMQLPDFANYTELARQLLRDHPTETARVLAAALKIRDIANKPEYASVNLDPKSTVWDDVIAVAAQIAAEPDVMKDVLDALADDDVLKLPQGMSAFAGNKDALDYNPAADSDASKINDPVWNTTTGFAAGKPSTKVDWSKPDSEDNRSLFQRFLSLINDSYTVKACNKQGAKVKTSLGLSLPLFGTYDECAMMEIPDLAVFYLGCIAGKDGTSTPRCQLPIKDGFVNALKSILGSGTMDSILENSSGIKGLTTHPTTEALNRFVMWRNPNDWVTSVTDPVATNVCPVATAVGTRKCADPKDNIRERQKATIFMGEEFNALTGLAPMIRPFVKKRADGNGREKYFIQLVQIFHRHWSQGSDPVRCVDGGTPDSNPRFCTKSNLRQFEGILSEAFATDLLPALNALGKVTRTMVINGQSGTDVMASLVRALVDPSVSKSIKLVDRHGKTGTVRNDGTPIDQVTPFYLFANAINGFDAMWAGSSGGSSGDKDHALWRAARSKLVDQFLGVDQPGGDPTKSQFSNAAIRAAGPIVLDLLEDRIAEHKAKGDFDAWVHGGLAKEFQDSVESPIFATLMDLMEKIYADDKARNSVGDLLVYLANQASANDALPSVLTATQDLLQVVGDDQNMVPLYHALAVGAAPDGATKRALDLMERIGNIEAGEFASTHGGRRVIPRVLANAVTPIGKTQVTPLEVFIDVISDLHRADPTSSDVFDAPDYGSVAKNVEQFLVDPTRGLEQFYAIVKNRNP